MAALKYWLWLTSCRGMDSVSALKVVECFGSPERAYYAGDEEYSQLPIRPALRKSLTDHSLDRAEEIMAECDRLNLRVMTIQDADDPQRLRQLADPPAVLYIRGKVFDFDRECAIGVVGTRQPTTYGEKYAERFGLELASGGALLVSGIAEGLDSCAIRGALKGGGPVVSVLAGGVDVPFPPQHRFLYEDVAAVGALLSEYPPGSPHRGFHFPRRNRILSGLSLGILAVECRPYGGTMSTVNHALEQDRDIFAIPGALDAPMSEGTNRLIQQGAKLVTCGRDILCEYWDRFPKKLAPSQPLTPEAAQARLEGLEQGREGPSRRDTAPTPTEERPEPKEMQQEPDREFIPVQVQKERFTDDELAILHALAEKDTLLADEVVELTQIPARRVLSALTMLQVQGVVEEHPGRRFSSCVELES